MGITFDDVKPLIVAVESAGLPWAEKLLTFAISPYVGPFAPLIASGVDSLVRTMNDRLGLPLDAPPTETAAKIMDDPAAATDKLSALEEQNRHTLEMTKAALDSDAQAQQLQAGLIAGDLAATQAGTWSRIYQAGWRPFVAWGLALQLGVFLFVPNVVWLVEVITTRKLPPLPNENFGVVLSTLAALMGLSGLRTVEKFGGVATASTPPLAVVTKAVLTARAKSR